MSVHILHSDLRVLHRISTASCAEQCTADPKCAAIIARPRSICVADNCDCHLVGKLYGNAMHVRQLFFGFFFDF